MGSSNKTGINKQKKEHVEYFLYQINKRVANMHMCAEIDAQIFTPSQKCKDTFLNIGCFFYLFNDTQFLTDTYDNYIKIDHQKPTELNCARHTEHYIKICHNYLLLWFKQSTYTNLPIQIKIPLHDMLQNKTHPIYQKYDGIIDKLNKLKKIFRDFIISKYNECLKYQEYAEEECLSSEKLLVTLSKINKYDSDLDNLVRNIIDLPIQKHTFCISSQININCNIIETSIKSPVPLIFVTKFIRGVEFSQIYNLLQDHFFCIYK
jgi:hypothetical protein